MLLGISSVPDFTVVSDEIIKLSVQYNQTMCSFTVNKIK